MQKLRMAGPVTASHAQLSVPPLYLSHSEDGPCTPTPWCL